MKLMVCLLVVAAYQTVQANNVVKRMNGIGAGFETNSSSNTSSLMSTITSGLSSPNPNTGVSPIYNILNTFTSGFYSDVANLVYPVLQPVSSLLNGISSNLFNILCAPSSSPVSLQNITAPESGSGPLLSRINQIFEALAPFLRQIGATIQAKGGLAGILKTLLENANATSSNSGNPSGNSTVAVNTNISSTNNNSTATVSAVTNSTI